MNVEEEYLDVLQNIEFVIAGVHRQEPQLVDFDVENAVNALLTRYKAQAQNHEARLPNLNDRAKIVYDAVEAVCEWRLKDDPAVSTTMNASGPQPAPVTLEIISACLKRIRKSIQAWNKQGGRQGYLTHIERFMR